MTDKLSGPVLITGASGFIGRRLRQALAEGEVVTLRRRASPPVENTQSFEVDYGDLQGLIEVIKKVRPAYVLHAAGVTKGVTYKDFQRGNVMPTENLLRALEGANHTPERFVFISSLTSYGPSTAERPSVETDERRPIEFYGKSKAEAETVVEASSLPWTILRPGGVYGPGDVDFYQHFTMAAKGWSVFFGNRHRLWSGVYVDDFIDATIAAAKSPSTVHRGYFVGDDEPYSWEQFQRAVGEHAGRKVTEIDFPGFFVSPVAVMGEWLTAIDRRPRVLNRQKAKMGAQAAWTCRSDAAKQDFDYRPSVGLNDGVTRTFAWYREQGWIPPSRSS